MFFLFFSSSPPSPLLTSSPLLLFSSSADRVRRGLIRCRALRTLGTLLRSPALAASLAGDGLDEGGWRGGEGSTQAKGAKGANAGSIEYKESKYDDEDETI